MNPLSSPYITDLHDTVLFYLLLLISSLLFLLIFALYNRNNLMVLFKVLNNLNFGELIIGLIILIGLTITAYFIGINILNKFENLNFNDLIYLSIDQIGDNLNDLINDFYNLNLNNLNGVNPQSILNNTGKLKNPDNLINLIWFSADRSNDIFVPAGSVLKEALTERILNTVSAHSFFDASKLEVLGTPVSTQEILTRGTINNDMFFSSLNCVYTLTAKAFLNEITINLNTTTGKFIWSDFNNLAEVPTWNYLLEPVQSWSSENSSISGWSHRMFRSGNKIYYTEDVLDYLSNFKSLYYNLAQMYLKLLPFELSSELMVYKDYSTMLDNNVELNSSIDVADPNFKTNMYKFIAEETPLHNVKNVTYIIELNWGKLEIRPNKMIYFDLFFVNRWKSLKGEVFPIPLNDFISQPVYSLHNACRTSFLRQVVIDMYCYLQPEMNSVIKSLKCIPNE